MKSADDDWRGAEPQHFLRCVVRHEMFRRIQSQADGVKRQSLLDRVGKSSVRTSEHEFDRVRVDRVGTSSRSDNASQRSSGCMAFETVPCDGYVDSDALRMAVSRGSSAKLGHLRVHADTCFRFLAQLPISLHRVSTTENEADIMTKVPSAIRHRELCKKGLGWRLTQFYVDTRDGKVWENRTRFPRARAQPHSS